MVYNFNGLNGYLELCSAVLLTGIEKKDRTNTGTLSLFGCTISYDLISDEFPLITSKFTNYKAVLNELLWFIKGETNINTLDSKIWNEWADETGSIGPLYGKQWRDWNGIDQLQNVINEIKNNPYSRRLIVNSWNVSDLPTEKVPSDNPKLGKMSLAPCHFSFQFIVENDYLSLMWNQRSVDIACGLPFNIASYATLLYMVCEITGLKPKRLIGSLGDCHIYNNHIDGIQKMILNNTINKVPKFPKLKINHRDNIDDFIFSDFEIIDYNHLGKIKFEIAV